MVVRRSTGAKHPLRGKKGDVYEGGIRVPFVVSWPGKSPAGKDYEPPVSSLDVFATALACAGSPMPTTVCMTASTCCRSSAARRRSAA